MGVTAGMDIPMLWTCTTVHRAHGRLRSSVWRAASLAATSVGNVAIFAGGYGR